MNQKLGFLDDSYVPRTSNIDFGVNVAKLLELKFNPNAGKDGTPRDAIEFKYDINGTDKDHRIYLPDSAYTKDGNLVDDPTHEAVIEAKQMAVRTIYHHFSPYIDAAKKQALMSKWESADTNSLQGIFNLYSDLVGTTYQNVDILLFMQYAWNLRDAQNRTYLEVPKNLKYGHFIAKIPGGNPEMEQVVLDTPDREKRKLIYRKIDDPSQVHPTLYRNEWYMDSNYAKKQTRDDAQEAKSEPTVGGGDDITLGAEGVQTIGGDDFKATDPVTPATPVTTEAPNTNSSDTPDLEW